MGFFSNLKRAVGKLHDATKWIDPIGHYSLDLAHQSSTDLVNETSRAIENLFGKDTWLGGLGEHWKNMSQKDKDDFGRWLTNTGVSAAAIYGGMAAAGGSGAGAAGTGVGAGAEGAAAGVGAGAGTSAAGGLSAAEAAGLSSYTTGGLSAAEAAAMTGGAGAAASGGGAAAGAAGGATGWGSYVQQGIGGLNALYQAYQSQKAADALLASGDAANATQRYMFDTINAQGAPYRTTAYSALERLNALFKDPSSVKNDPGYAFGMQEGQRAIDNSASARGGIGGAALKAGARFAEDYATTKTNDVFNRNFTAAGLANPSNAQSAASGMNMANNISQTQMGMGNALAGNYLNQGNIYGNALNQFGAWAGKNWGSGG